MIKFENLATPSPEQWLSAIRGMRNPLASWDRMDSEILQFVETKIIDIGDNDLSLIQRLCNAGSEHRKFLRMLYVTVDITAPLYYFKQFDTYKVGTTSNSESTMHCIHKQPFTLDMFSYDATTNSLNYAWLAVEMVENLNKIREDYLQTKSKDIWKVLIEHLPSSFNQTRTVCLNYETLLNMYYQRKGHKLQEWSDFCDWVETLPLMEVLIKCDE